MLTFIIKILGYLLSRMPLMAGALSISLGHLIYYTPNKRSYMLRSNLQHAFPEKAEAWHAKTAKKSCQQMVELGLFVLASPFMSKSEINKRFSLSEQFKKKLNKEGVLKKPHVILIPHFALMECITLFPACHEGKIPKTGVIYRPLFNKALEKWVKKTRERFGIQLLSRKQGFTDAMKILRNNGSVAILFDQNAGYQGTLSTFFGRVVSTTELPDLLVKKFNTDVYFVYPENKGFWKADIHIEALKELPKTTSIIKPVNNWLENKLQNNDILCSSWLWLHNRWRTQDEPHRRFHISNKRNGLDEELSLPRKTRFWIRMPNWLGDVVMAVPLIKALRESRPDAEITLLAQESMLPLLEKMNITEHLIALPRKGLTYFWHFWKMRKAYPDTFILFTNSTRGDIEAFLTRTPQRFGIQRQNRSRSWLTHTWNMPDNIDESKIHQTHLWEKYFRHFGLIGSLKLDPIEEPTEKEGSSFNIGMICGTENSPEKRWPISHWRELIQALVQDHPDIKIKLLGTPNDRSITNQVAEGFKAQNIMNLAGKTDLPGFVSELKECDLVVCNDTGGMHLANALGVPVMVIYGPTNPVRTGPIFNCSNWIIQPEGCPKTGGYSIAEVSAASVQLKINKHFKETKKNKFITNEQVS